MPKAKIAVGIRLISKTEINIHFFGQTCILNRKIQGTLSKQPAFIYRDSFEVKDLKNNFIAKVNFIATKAKSKLGGFLGGNKDEKLPRNQVDIKIVKVAGGKEVPLMIGSGNYLRYVQFGGEYTWKYTDKTIEFQGEVGPNVLPSSSINRKELSYIVEKKYVEADKLCEALEEQELKDEKSRKKFAKIIEK